MKRNRIDFIKQANEAGLLLILLRLMVLLIVLTKYGDIFRLSFAALSTKTAVINKVEDKFT